MADMEENADILEKCDELLETIQDDDIIEVVDEFKQEITEQISPTTCKFCLENYDDNSSGPKQLKQHYYSKHGYCPDCDMNFADKKENLLLHLNKKHGKRVKCDHGSCKYMGFETELKAHFENVHGQKTKCSNLTFSLSYKCKMCSSVQIYESDLVHHYAIEHNYCYHCKKVFGRKEFAVDHMKEKHKIEAKRIYRCKFCYISKSDEHEIHDHYTSVHNYCDECKKSYKTPEEIKKHQQDRHGKKIKCTMCDFETNMTNVFNAHIRTVHRKLAEGQAKCKFCGLIRFSISDLKKHCFMDHRYCIDCGNQYDTKELILNHCNQKHSMQVKCGNFQCDFQDFDWEVKQHERAHASTHAMMGSQSGQVKCKICNVSKYSLKDLKQHYFIEHKHCLDCDITFESHTLGREHTRDIHKMKIKCDQCSYSSYEWSVRFHQKKHQAFSQNKKEPFNESLMPKITSIAGNVIKIVDDNIISVDSPMAKKMKIEVNAKQPNKPGPNCQNCPLCKWKRYYSLPDLKKHCYTTHRYCYTCQKPFTDEQKLFQHCHTEHEMNIDCDLCSFKSFDWILEIHRKTEHGIVAASSKRLPTVVTLNSSSRVIKSVSNKGKISTTVTPRAILPKSSISLSGINQVQTVNIVQPFMTTVIDEITGEEIVSSEGQSPSPNVSGPTKTSVAPSSLIISTIPAGARSIVDSKTQKTKVSTPPALRGILLCGVCKVPVADEMDMKKHRKHFKCTDCDFVTISEDELDSHISGKHSILPD